MGADEWSPDDFGQQFSDGGGWRYNRAVSVYSVSTPDGGTLRLDGINHLYELRAPDGSQLRLDAANGIYELLNAKQMSIRLDAAGNITLNATNQVSVIAPKLNLFATAPGVSGTPTAWTPTTAYALNELVTDAAGSVWRCTTAGVSGETTPGWSGTGSSLNDGSVTWGGATSASTFVALDTSNVTIAAYQNVTISVQGTIALSAQQGITLQSQQDITLNTDHYGTSVDAWATNYNQHIHADPQGGTVAVIPTPLT